MNTIIYYIDNTSYDDRSGEEFVNSLWNSSFDEIDTFIHSLFHGRDLEAIKCIFDEVLPNSSDYISCQTNPTLFSVSCNYGDTILGIFYFLSPGVKLERIVIANSLYYSSYIDNSEFNFRMENICSLKGNSKDNISVSYPIQFDCCKQTVLEYLSFIQRKIQLSSIVGPMFKDIVEFGIFTETFKKYFGENIYNNLINNFYNIYVTLSKYIIQKMIDDLIFDDAFVAAVGDYIRKDSNSFKILGVDTEPLISLLTESSTDELDINEFRIYLLGSHD